MILIDQEEIIEVSAHGLCGSHIRVKIKLCPVGISRECPGKHGFLDLRRHGHLGVDPLLLRRDRNDLVHIGLHLSGHGFEGFRKDLDLVPGFVDILHLEIHFRIRELPDFIRHKVNGFHPFPGESADEKDRRYDKHRKNQHHQNGGLIEDLP